MTTMDMLDTDKLLDALGGNASVRALYLAAGREEPGAEVLRRWRERKSIPPQHAFFLMIQATGGEKSPLLQFANREPLLCKTRRTSKEKHVVSGALRELFD